MKLQTPLTRFLCWRNDQLFNIDFASYTLSHHSFPRHFHDHYVIELVLAGADHFFCAGKNYIAESGNLVLINPGELHTGSTTGNTQLQYFSFYPDKKALQEVAATLAVSLPETFSFPSTLNNRSAITEKMTRLYHSLIHAEDILLQQEYFYDCMQSLFNQGHKEKDSVIKKDQRVNRVIDFIMANFMEPVSLKQMADQVNVTPFHLLRLFKKSTGLSPYEYLIIVRTGYAKQLIQKGHRVEEAALQAGFYDTSHLNRSFRKIAATSPKSFLSPKGQYCTSITG